MAELGREADLPDFVELLEEAAAWLWSRDIPQWEPGSMRRQLQSLRSMIEQGDLLVERQGGRIVAGCVLTRAAGEAWSELVEPCGGGGVSAAYLSKLAVARSLGGRALGAEIVAAAEHWTAEQRLDRLRLDCWDGSDRLRSYYRELGFMELEAAREHGYWVRLFEKRVLAV